MAGSITYREYESDHGTKYSIRVDESNARLFTGVGGQSLCNLRTATWKLPPKTLILRRIHVFSQFNPRIKRSFIVGNKLVILSPDLESGNEFISTPSPSDGQPEQGNWIITGYTGEKFSPPVYFNNADTGLTDGTPFMV